MPVTDILEIGKQGMDVSRQALQTSSNNVANANTPGYSRQRAQISTNDQTPQGQNRIHGVNVKETVRVHDRFIQNQIVDESQVLGAAKSRMQGLKLVESTVHNDAYRVGDLLNNFFNDFRELSANPEVNALRSNVTFSAKEAINGFRALGNNLHALRDDIDMQIAVAVDSVNTLAREVADLNAKIARFEARGEAPLELLDRRDMAVREIADKLGFQDSTDGQGNSNISAGGLGVLVNGSTVSELVVLRTPEKNGKAAGSYDVFVRDGEGLRAATHYIRDGAIGGLIYVRDEVINPTLGHLDDVAYRFAKSVNDVHEQGVGADGLSGRKLFALPQTIEDASLNLQVSDDVLVDSGAIAVGIQPDYPADNRIAKAIAELQSLQLVSDEPGLGSKNTGRQTLNESLNSLVGKVAVQVEHEDHIFRHQEAILGQLENYRQSVSGVNLDEEAIAMMQYQAVFNASAKAMKVGDELLNTILSIKT
jgi:flagellar hook-associated protein 1 FlgK